MNTSHIPVLLNETLLVLNPSPGESFIDGTYGGGGHSAAIWKQIGPEGRLLAIDWNEQAIQKCTEAFGHVSQITCAVGNFAQLIEIAHLAQFGKVNGLLLDLGISSDELQHSGRGFSFQKCEPLIMTYNNTEKPVMEILKHLTEEELERIIKIYGEERNARRIARIIKKYEQLHPIETTDMLANIIESVSPRRGKLHPATRTFMALRIYANNEIENLTSILNNIPELVAPGGRIAIITFHSLEDRLVKQTFRELVKKRVALFITKKPIKPTREETLQNPRSRSAKLRAIQII